jgi:hypothetical protein
MGRYLESGEIVINLDRDVESLLIILPRDWTFMLCDPFREYSGVVLLVEGDRKYLNLPLRVFAKEEETKD